MLKAVILMYIYIYISVFLQNNVKIRNADIFYVLFPYSKKE